MTTVTEVISSMKQRFNPEAAAGLDKVFQLDITDGDTYHLIVENGTCDIKEGASEDPDVTLIMDSQTMVNIMTGEQNGMMAFMSGKVRAEGNMMLAGKLNDLFPL